MIHVGCNSCLCVVASSLFFFTSSILYRPGPPAVVILPPRRSLLLQRDRDSRRREKNNFYPPEYHMCEDRDSRPYHRVRSGGGEWENGTGRRLRYTLMRRTKERNTGVNVRTLFRATWQLPRCFFTVMMKVETGWRDLFNLFLVLDFRELGIET